MYHSNIRGFNSKKVSLLAIIKQINPSIITLNEIALKKNKKLSIPGYFTYNRNRCTENMGGLSTSVKDEDKCNVIKTFEGENKDEILITRHSQFSPPINIINIYGETESRAKNSDIEDRWTRVLDRIAEIEANEENIVIIGDLNKSVGNGECGVEYNHCKVTFGGKSIHKLLAGGKYVLANNSKKCKGGPFTRYDPADPANEKRMSCLDLAIISVDLSEYLVELKIDREKLITPHRAVGKKLVYTDHFSLIMTFRDLPKSLNSKIPTRATTMWNTRKEGGWEAFKKLTSDNEDLKKLKNETNKEPTEFFKKFEAILTKIKFKVFGKVKFRSIRIKNDKELEKLYHKKSTLEVGVANSDKIEKVESEIAGKLIATQRKDFEKKLEDLKDVKKNKGKSAALFKLKDKVCGEKKQKQEPVTLKDPISGEILSDHEKIKESSLNYLKNLLTNRQPKEKYENDLISLQLIHSARMNSGESGDDKLCEEDFVNLLKKLRKSGGEKYKLIVQGGTDLHGALFQLYKQVWEKETKPEQWEDTLAISLYKGKGLKSDFNNQRFIHTKLEFPKAFEQIVIEKAKPKIIRKCSKFQIGAIPKHRAQEHLYTMKSVISWYEQLKIPLILQLFDISKFFDREVLVDGMNSLHNCDIVGKLYRMIFELNRTTNLRVQTGVGISRAIQVGPNITQGSVGGGLISSVNLDHTINQYFSRSEHEISFVDQRLQPMIFQDDLSRLTSTIVGAQAGNYFVESCMETKLLDLNTDKSCYIIVGSKKVTKQIKEDLESCPLLLCGQKMKEKVSDKYLGDYVHSLGNSDSAHQTINERYGRIVSCILEARAIIDDCRSSVVGGLGAGIDLWELAYLPSLLNNCETWVDLSENSLKMLEDLQHLMYRTLLSVPKSTPTPALCWDMGGTLMRFRVIQKKLGFISHVKNLEMSSLARQILETQKEYRMKGLADECETFCRELKIPNILEEEIPQNKWKKIVKTAIRKENEETLTKQMKCGKYKKLVKSCMVNETFQRRDYINTMLPPDARTMFKYRTNMTEHVKMNYSSDPRYKADLWRCDSCQVSIDTQQHVLWCPSYSELRQGKDLSSDKDLTSYLRDVLVIRAKLNLNK